MSKKLFSKVFILLLVVGLLFAVTPTRQAQAATITVGPGGDFTTIQAAIDAVTTVDGDVIVVSPGTYVENVIVNKKVTLDGEGDPFVPATAAVVQGLIHVTADGATVRNLKVSPGAVTGQDAAILVSASDTTLIYNLVDGMAGNGTYSIKGIFIYNDSEPAVQNVTLEGNTIRNISNTPGVKASVGIQIQGVLDGVYLWGNVVEAISSNGWAYGIEVTPTGAAPSIPPQEVFIGSNSISGVTAVTYPGVAVSIDQVDATHTADASVVYMDSNTIIGAPVALVNKDTGNTLTAEYNYWGSPTGPAAGTIGGKVDYVPFWSTAAGDPVTPPVHNTTQDTYFFTIQDAIDVAAAGDAIYVGEGTYNEDLTIDESLTLSGAGYDVSGNYLTIVNGISTNGDGGVLNIKASNVTVELLKLVAAGHKTIRVTEPASGVNILNNYVVGATNPVGNYPSLFENDYGELQTNLRITGNTFENHGSQAGVYVNPTHPGLIVKSNIFKGDPTSGPVLGIDQMDGTEVITGNSFVGITSPHALFEGFVTVPIVDIFNANTWPAGYIASGKMVVPASVVYPSTNDINRTNGWAHVNFISADATARTMTFEFVPHSTMSPAYSSCFERRTDGDTSQIVTTNGGNNWNPLILDGLYPYNCYYAQGSSVLKTYTVIDYIEFRLSFGGESDERFYWTRFDLIDEVWVDDDFTSATPGWGVDHFAVIQDGIEAVAAGGTVNVAAGTYNEGILLNKPNVTVKATDGAQTTFINTPAGTLTVGVQVLANMGTVTFDGFTVQNFTESGIVQGMASAVGTTFHVKNNVVTPAAGYLRNGIQVSGDGSTVTGNTVNGAPLTDSWSSSGILAVNGSNILIEGNTILGGTLGLDIGIGVQSWSVNAANVIVRNNNISGANNGIRLEGSATSRTITNVLIETNTIDRAIRAINSQFVTLVDIEAHLNKFLNITDTVLRISDSSALGSMDATHNWFGDALGPQNPIVGDVQVIKWCADEGCTIFLPNDNGDVPIIGDPFTQTGAIKLYVDGVNYYLPAGTTIQNDSPCFEVYADDIKIYTDYPAAAKCVPTDGSDGIWVADGVESLRVVGLEFDGTGQTTGDGIHFAGVVTNFQIIENYFHDLGASGVVFTGTPSGSTMDIQGNMFQDLGAASIVSPASINAEYNSWGVYAGATLTNVDTEPHTHADFYMTFEGETPLEKVAIGNTITYTVYGNLQNISGADFTLKFPTDYLDAGTPTNLSAFSAAGPAMFTVDELAGTIRFQGDASFTPITGENLPIFEVVFTGTAAGTGAISFDLTNDVFSMSPGYGPSTWVYAAGYVDNEVEVFLDETAPTLETWTPDEGDIYLAEGEDFVLTVDALDDNLFSLEIDHNVTTLPEFTVYAFASNVYGSPEAAAQFLAAGVTVTYDEATQTWVLTFASDGTALAELLAKKDVTFYTVLHDQAGKTWGSMDPTTDENTFAYSIVFDNTAPALESWTPAKDMTYMLTPSGDFVLTVDAMDVNLFGLELDHSLEGVLPEFWVYADADPYGGEVDGFTAAGLAVTYNSTTQTWTLTFENGGAALDAIIANQGITFYAVIHDLAGNKWGSMYDVEEFNTFAYTLYQQQPIARADSTGGAVVAVVSADGNTIDFTGEVDWYPADPDLGRTSGHRIGVRLSAPELDFGTADTTFTFNGQTYDWDLVKDGDDYVLVYPKVTAPIQTWEIVVTWGGGFSQTFTVNFNGTLGPVTAYTVEGEISMQGRVARNTEDVITLDGYELDDFTADSLDKLGINYTLSDVLTGEYTIVTNQPRYLNIYCNEDSTDAIPDFCKKITLISDRTLPTLWLRGGNAIWTDNEITLDDANQVGTDWGSVLDPDGNVNFDGIVNIQDLALVGGNYGLTSADADAYGTWAP